MTAPRVVTPAERDRVRVSVLQRGARELISRLEDKRVALDRFEVSPRDELKADAVAAIERGEHALLELIDVLVAIDVAYARPDAPGHAVRLRDARGGELAQEPDVVLQALAEGSLEASATTRQLARQELDARRLRR